MKLHLIDLKNNSETKAHCNSKNALYITTIENFARNPEQQCKKCKAVLEERAHAELAIQIVKDFPEFFKVKPEYWYRNDCVHQFIQFLANKLHSEDSWYSKPYIQWLDSRKKEKQEILDSFLAKAKESGKFYILSHLNSSCD